MCNVHSGMSGHVHIIVNLVSYSIIYFLDRMFVAIKVMI